MARFILFTGVRWAEERVEVEKPLAGVLRRFSKSRTSAVVRRAADKLRIWLDRDEAASLIETWLQEADLPLLAHDLRQIAASAVNRNENACARLVEIAIHLFLLSWFRSPTRRPAYTWDPVEEDFVDPLTKATRILLNDPNFDPRPAYRLLLALEIRRQAS